MDFDAESFVFALQAGVFDLERVVLLLGLVFARVLVLQREEALSKQFNLVGEFVDFGLVLFSFEGAQAVVSLLLGQL